jgi:ABC-type cobalamin/Fe3+-siderophores transport system ATPase subunit
MNITSVWPYISEITLKNDTKFSFNQNDIVVFVGANNCGKTTILKEIMKTCPKVNNKSNKIIKKTFHEQNWSISDIIDYIKSSSIKKTSSTLNSEYYEWFNFKVYARYLQDKDKFLAYMKEDYNDYIKIFMSILDTETRLTLLKPINKQKNSDEQPTHLYHLFVNNYKFLLSLNKVFKKVFGLNLCYNNLYNRYWEIEFKVSNDEIKSVLESDSNYTKNQQKYEQLEPIEMQWDWIRSFTGIIAELIIEKKNIYFIDEPESFLHWPQALILWEEITKLATEKQIFITTHSQDLIKWLIKSKSDRIKILKLNRDWNKTEIKELRQEDLLEIQKNSFLYYSNYLESLFNNFTIICEHYTDCLFYSKMFDIVLEENSIDTKSINYISTSWKWDFDKIRKLSDKMWINYGIVWDIDFLNNRHMVKNFCNIGFESERKLLNEKVLSLEPISKSWLDFKVFINSSYNDDDILKRDDGKKVIQYFKSLKKPRDRLKEEWISVIFKWRRPDYYSNLIKELNKNRLFLVPVGELEKFIPIISEEKENRLLKAMELLPKDKKLKKAKLFILEIINSLWIK